MTPGNVPVPFPDLVNRSQILRAIAETSQPFDILVIGGGATGLGAAWDAATRGYRTLLVERDDFSQGTSSRSTKLIHGGVRYLEQFNFSLVRESLREREWLLTNAPSLVTLREFVIPAFRWWERYYFGAGLKLYDALAGKLGGRKSRLLGREEVLERLPGIQSEGLVGGISYWDGQFDDAKLAMALVTAVNEAGGLAINHVGLESFIGTANKLRGAKLKDYASGDVFQVEAKAMINATGVQSDILRQWDSPDSRKLVAASRGSHIILPPNRIGGNAALMIPKTRDGRVLFAIPWLDHLLVGTTDVATDETNKEPHPSLDEIDFLLEHVNEHLAVRSERSDILSAFAGLRPLVRPSKNGSTSSIPRDHHIEVSRRGLVSVVGGKWTTFRKMGEETVDQVVAVTGLPQRRCVTPECSLAAPTLPLADAPTNGRLAFTEKQIQQAIGDQLALTAEDMLARRSRCLFLNAQAAIAAAPDIIKMMGKHLGKDPNWEATQLAEFKANARHYLPAGD